VAFHRDKTETTAFAAKNISDDFNGADFTVLGKERVYRCFSGIERQIAYKNSFQLTYPKINRVMMAIKPEFMKPHQKNGAYSVAG